MSSQPLLPRAENCPYYTGAPPQQEEGATVPTYMTGAAASISWQADDAGTRPLSYYPAGAPYPHHHMSTVPPHVVRVPHPSALYDYYAAPPSARQEDVLIITSYNGAGADPASTANISSVVPNPAPSYAPHHHQAATDAAPTGVAGMNVMSAVGTGGGEPFCCAQQEASSAGAPSPYLLLVNPPAPLKPGSTQAPPAMLGTTTYAPAPVLFHHQANIYTSTSAALPSSILPQPSLCQQQEQYCCPHSVSSSHCGGGAVTTSTSAALPNTILPQPRSLSQQQEQYRHHSVSLPPCGDGVAISTSSTGISVTTQQDHFCSNTPLPSHDQDLTIKIQAEKIRQLEALEKHWLEKLMNEDNQEHVPYPPAKNTKKKMERARKKQRKDGPRRTLSGYHFFYMNEVLKMKSLLLESGPSGGDNKVENPMISDVPACAFEEEAREVMDKHGCRDKVSSCFEVDSKTWLEKCDAPIYCSCQNKGEKLKKWEEHCKKIFQFLDEKKKIGKKRDRKKNTSNRDDKMDATQLAKIVSTRWRQLHPYRKEYFLRLSKADSERYRMEKEEYNAKNNNF